MSSLVLFSVDAAIPEIYPLSLHDALPISRPDRALAATAGRTPAAACHFRSRRMSAMAPRKIGPVLATFVVANNMIGSGFFLLPSTLARSGGVTALSWLLCTLLAVMLGGAFARLARHHPGLESPDDYV